MRLKLERPLATIDFETTGVDPQKDRIVQIGIKKIMPIGLPEYYDQLVNPTIPIPPGATKIHGITNEMVKDSPTFKEIAVEVMEFIRGCDISGYCVLSYDAPLLYCEFLRAEVIWNYSSTRFIDSANIARRKEPRNLTWATQFYCGRELEGAHGAKADADAAADVLFAQVERYEDVPENVEELALYSNYDKRVLDLSGKFKMNDAGEIVFAFGKNINEPAKSHQDYLSWILNADFAPDTKDLIRTFLSAWKKR